MIKEVHDGQEQLVVNGSYYILESTVLEQENIAKQLAKDDEKRQASDVDVIRGHVLK